RRRSSGARRGCTRPRSSAGASPSLSRLPRSRAGSIDPLRDGGLDHVAPHLDVADRRHRLIWLAHRVEDRLGLVHVLAPREIDPVRRGGVASFRIAAVRGAGEHLRNALDQWAIGFGHLLLLPFPAQPVCGRLGSSHRLSARRAAITSKSDSTTRINAISAAAIGLAMARPSSPAVATSSPVETTMLET